MTNLINIFKKIFFLAFLIIAIHPTANKSFSNLFRLPTPKIFKENNKIKVKIHPPLIKNSANKVNLTKSPHTCWKIVSNQASFNRCFSHSDVK